MNHDITHCSGTDVLFPTTKDVIHKTCPKRETCYRYKAYLDLRNYENSVVSMLFPDCCMTKDYYMYWEDKK